MEKSIFDLSLEFETQSNIHFEEIPESAPRFKVPLPFVNTANPFV